MALHALARAALPANGSRVFGVGAPSRASTLINYVGLDREIVDCVVEVKGSYKVGKYMPGTLIPVVDEARAVRGAAGIRDAAVVAHRRRADAEAHGARVQGRIHHSAARAASGPAGSGRSLTMPTMAGRSVRWIDDHAALLQDASRLAAVRDDIAAGRRLHRAQQCSTPLI